MVNYLQEFRQRLIRCSLFLLLCFVTCFYWSGEVFQEIVSPLVGVLDPDVTLVATKISAPVLAPLQLAWYLAVLCTLPYALYQVWQFVSPALYRQEKSMLNWVLCTSFLLFIFGGVFCFYGVLPFVFHLLANASPFGVKFMPDITDSVRFILCFLGIFGLCFQMPLVCVVLVRVNWASVTTLREWRPYVIVLAFTVGMLLTPPDVLSQVLVAVPLCLLYELSILLCRWFPLAKVVEGVHY